jgi:hypothetical protein
MGLNDLSIILKSLNEEVDEIQDILIQGFKFGHITHNKIDRERIEFSIYDKDFVLLYKTELNRGISRLETYQIVINKENYPNLKLEHIPKLDIHLQYGRNTTFVIDQSVITSENIFDTYSNRISGVI